MDTPDSIPQAGREITSQTGTHGPLGDFTLHLIQAMLRTGYYAEEHPEARKALSGLHAQFVDLMEDRPELVYLVSQTRAGREITIEGYEEEPLPLYRVMMKGMADLFTPKFLEFLDRWNLLSFSIRREANEAEFQAFVVLMSQPPTAAGSKSDAGERLTHAFVERNILHISTVFDRDIVGRDRRLPWRVKMALSRLRRDLRMLPLYRRATPEQLQRIKLQIIDDVIRPMRTPKLLKAFLVNYDLVAADIDVLDETQVEREIVANLSEPMLLATAEELIADLEGADAPQDHQSVEAGSEMARQLGVLHDIADRLCSIGTVMERDFVEALVERGVLREDDLPPKLRRAMETRKLADLFSEREEECLSALRKLRDDEAGRRLAAVVERIVPDLLRRAEYGTVGRIVGALEAGLRGTPSALLRDLATRFRTAVARQETLHDLVEEVPYREKEERDALLDVVVFAGEPAGPVLLDAYERAEERATRMILFEGIRRIGAGALSPLLTRLPSMGTEWSLLHHIITAVGELGDASLAEQVAGYLHHSNMHVRQAAVTAIFKLVGPDAEEHLIPALRDPEATIRQMAVTYLGQLGSRAPELVQFCTAALDPDDPEATAEEDGVMVAICRALPQLDGQEEWAASLLTSALVALRHRGVLDRIKKPPPQHSDRVRVAICESLASVGDPAALQALDGVAGGEEGAVATAALDAAARIRGTVSEDLNEVTPTG